MKQLVIALMVALTFSSAAWGQKKDTILTNSVSKEKITTTKTAPATQIMKIDPQSGLEYIDVVDSTHMSEGNEGLNMDFDLGKTLKDAGITGNAINKWFMLSTISVIVVFVFPLVIIFMAFYFRYKNKKAKYKLIEQALAAGQPLPQELLKSNIDESLNLDSKRTAGIKQTFLGLGLFVFLWAITGSFGVGCIGLLIMCIGLGKWITALDKNRRDGQR